LYFSVVRVVRVILMYYFQQCTADTAYVTIKTNYETQKVRKSAVITF